MILPNLARMYIFAINKLEHLDSVQVDKDHRPPLFSGIVKFLNNFFHIQPDYPAIQRTCNLWRNHFDIQDTWDSVQSTIKYYGMDDGNFSSYAKPGAWNDPDMVRETSFIYSYNCV